MVHQGTLGGEAGVKDVRLLWRDRWWFGGPSVDGLQVSGNRAYVITGAYSNLVVLDVTSATRVVESGRMAPHRPPGAPSMMGTWGDSSSDRSGLSTCHENRGDFQEADRRAFVSRAWSTATGTRLLHTASSLEIVDACDPTNLRRPALFGSPALPYGGTGFNAMAVVDRRAYLYGIEVFGLPLFNDSLFVFEMDDAGALRLVARSNPGVAPGMGTWRLSPFDSGGLAPAANRLFALGYGSRSENSLNDGYRLVMLDLGDPLAPVIVAGESDNASIARYLQLEVQGDYLYADTGSAELRIYRTWADPARMDPIATNALAGTNHPVRVSGTYAFLANDPSGVVVWDLSDPQCPTEITRSPCPANRLDVVGDPIDAADSTNLWILEQVEDVRGPEVVTHPRDQTVQANSTVTLAGTASGTPPLWYRWQTRTASGDWDDVNGALVSSLVLAKVQLADAGLYRAIVSNDFGATTSRVATLRVMPLTPRYVTAPPATVGTFTGSGAGGRTDGAAGDAAFHGPQGGAFDAAGILYVADTGNHAIRRVGPDGTTATLAGIGTAGFRDGPAPTSQFASPRAVCVDAAGNVWVADTENHRIRKITADGQVSTAAGSGTRGYRDGPAALAEFDSPGGVVVDDAGNLYLTEFNNHTVRRVGTNGEVSTVVGNGAAGTTDGRLAEGRLKGPRGLAIDRRGDLYVAEWGAHRIRKIEQAAGLIRTLTGSGEAGYVDGPPDQVRLREPDGIAVDALGWVYFADNGNHAVRRVSQAGVVETVAGAGVPGFADGPGAEARFSEPGGLAVDGYGELYVMDADNHRVRRVSLPRKAAFIDLRFAEAGRVGETLRLSPEVLGTPPLGYQWQRFGTNVLGATHRILEFPSLAIADAGVYRLAISNAAGRVVSANISLTVLPQGSTPVTSTRRGSWPGFAQRSYVRSAEVEISARRAFVLFDNSPSKGLALSIFDLTEPADPLEVGFVELDRTDSTNPGGLTIEGNYVFVTCYHYVWPSPWAARMFVVDVSDPTRPAIVGTYQYSESPFAGLGPVRISGRHAYVAGANPEDSLHVVDLSDVTRPRKLTTLAPQGYVLDLAGRYAYAAGTGFKVLDLANPENPVQVASLSEGASTVRKVRVAEGFAYAATRNGLRIADVRDPQRPSWLGNLTPCGSARDLRVQGSRVFVVGYDDPLLELGPALHIFDVRDPAHPVRLGSPTPLAVSNDSSDSRVHALAVDGGLACAAMEYSLAVLDVSDPSNVVRRGTYRPGKARTVRWAGEHAAVLDGGLKLIDVNPPGRPRLVANQGAKAANLPDIDDLQLWGQYALAWQYEPSWPAPRSFLNLLDLRDPNRLTLVERWGEPVAGFCVGSREAGISTEVGRFSGFPIGYWHATGWRFDRLQLNGDSKLEIIPGGILSSNPPRAMASDGRYAYVVSGRRLDIFDFQYPTPPVLLGSTATSGESRALAVAGNRAYLALETNAVEVIDVSQPRAPVPVARLGTAFGAYTVRAAGPWLFVLERRVEGFAVGQDDVALVELFDLADPGHPVRLGAYEHVGQAVDFELVGNRMLIADGWRGLAVVDVVTPEVSAQTPAASCPVTRFLPGSYVPGANILVRLEVRPEPEVAVYLVDDRPPSGWAASALSPGGIQDPETFALRFGPFADAMPRVLTYTLAVPATADGPQPFLGSVVANGRTTEIAGARELVRARWHPADRSPPDGRLLKAERERYVTAWRTGQRWGETPAAISVNEAVRAATLWAGGEVYDYEPRRAAAPICWTARLGGSLPGPGPLGAARRTLPATFTPGEAFQVACSVPPPIDAFAFAIEENVPAGWLVDEISDEGVFDPVAWTVRWGPFLDRTSRNLRYRAQAPASAGGSFAFSGVISWDGLGLAITGETTTRAVIRVLSFTFGMGAGGESALELGHAPEADVVVEASEDLAHWEPLAESRIEGRRVIFRDPRMGVSPSRFYRVNRRLDLDESSGADRFQGIHELKTSNLKRPVAQGGPGGSRR